jgi:hypothetical protein
MSSIPVPVPSTAIRIAIDPIRIVHSLDPNPEVTNRLTSLEKLFMATIAEFKASVLQKIADNQAASASEHTQVLAAIQALKDQVGGIVSEADVAEVNAAFDAATAGVANIFEPDAPAAVAARTSRH